MPQKYAGSSPNGDKKFTSQKLYHFLVLLITIVRKLLNSSTQYNILLALSVFFSFFFSEACLYLYFFGSGASVHIPKTLKCPRMKYHT